MTPASVRITPGSAGWIISTRSILLRRPPMRRHATSATATTPSIADGARFVMRDVPGEPRLIRADSVGMLQPDDAGQIAVTASHGALSGGRPDNAIPEGICAVFFSDAGGGMNGAGIARLADLDRKGVVAGTTSADSAPIGDSRALYRDGILSHVNGAATRFGGRVGMPLKEFVDLLIAASTASRRVNDSRPGRRCGNQAQGGSMPYRPPFPRNR
jgi:hypothetical protein